MTKAEHAAVNCVNRAYSDFVNPGKYRGINFNRESFDIKKYVEGFVFLAYTTNRIPKKSIEKALNLAECLWKEKINEKIVQ